MPFASAAVSLEKIFDVGRTFLLSVDYYTDVTIFFILFTILFAASWIGINTVNGEKGWSKNAMLAIAVAISLGLSIPVSLWISKVGTVTDLIGNIAKPVLILITIAVIGVFGAIFYNASEKKSKSIPYIISISIILLDSLLSKLYAADWTDKLGGIGTIFDLMLFFSWLFFVISMFSYVIKAFSKNFKGKAPKVASTGKGLIEGIRDNSPFIGRKARAEKRANRDAKRGKVALLNEYIEEKRELELLNKAKDKCKNFEAELSSGATAKLKSSFKEVTKSINEAQQEINRLKRNTFRQERKSQQLIKDLKDAEIKDDKIQQAIVYERNILRSHDQVLDEFKQIMARVNALNALNLSKVSNSGTILNGIGEIILSLARAINLQEKAYEESESLMAIFQKYWKPS